MLSVMSKTCRKKNKRFGEMDFRKYERNYYNNIDIKKRNYPIKTGNKLLSVKRKYLVSAVFFLSVILLIVTLSKSILSKDENKLKITKKPTVLQNNILSGTENLLPVNFNPSLKNSKQKSIGEQSPNYAVGGAGFNIYESLEYKGSIEDSGINFSEIVDELQNYEATKDSAPADDDFLYQMFYLDLQDDDFDIDESNESLKNILKFRNYKIRSRDNVKKIAKRFGLRPDTVISVNNLKSRKSIRIGEHLIIPNRNGTIHTIKNGESLDTIAKKYKKYRVTTEKLQNINGIFEEEKLVAGTKLFIPGGRLPGYIIDRFGAEYAKPLRGVITSAYGWRRNPFSHRGKEFHPGIDIAAPYGAPVRAAKSGRVRFAGWKGGYGKLVIIDHGGGLESRYGHQSKILVKKGQKVRKKQIIGKVGSTGRSTGPHLHFEVRKHNKIINPNKLSGLRGKKYSRFNY